MDTRRELGSVSEGVFGFIWIPFLCTEYICRTCMHCTFVVYLRVPADVAIASSAPALAQIQEEDDLRESGSAAYAAEQLYNIHSVLRKRNKLTHKGTTHHIPPLSRWIERIKHILEGLLEWKEECT